MLFLLESGVVARAPLVLQDLQGEQAAEPGALRCHHPTLLLLTHHLFPQRPQQDGDELARILVPGSVGKLAVLLCGRDRYSHNIKVSHLETET